MQSLGRDGLAFRMGYAVRVGIAVRQGIVPLRRERGNDLGRCRNPYRLYGDGA